MAPEREREREIPCCTSKLNIQISTHGWSGLDIRLSSGSAVPAEELASADDSSFTSEFSGAGAPCFRLTAIVIIEVPSGGADLPTTARKGYWFAFIGQTAQ